MKDENLYEIVEEAIELTSHKKSFQQVRISNLIPKEATFNCRLSDLIMVITNLLNNSYDAIKDLDEKWVNIEYQKDILEYLIVARESQKIWHLRFSICSLQQSV